ncbi:MAG TPA: zinc ribbon domain-containing protein [Bryobacteraceae bacterium]|jgi:putative FmdB family regulatory protein|nr:zinc ribbon domain-containing protein [Bryobacteraceae bacterium]
MPLYEYRCRKCGQRFELLRRMQDADRELVCPECRSQEVERQFSTFAAGGCATGGSGRFT